MNVAWLAGLLLASGTAIDTESIDLNYRSSRNWDLELPNEQWLPVSGGFAVSHAGGDQIAAVLDGMALIVDSDGDGVPDRRVEGKKDDAGVRSAVVTVEYSDDAGTRQRYSARLMDRGAGWHYAPAGVMTGKIGKTKLQLIDQNLNGRYDDVGVDAMVVGRSDIATYLSSAIHVDGELMTLEVDPSGKRISVAPFSGETGTLDLHSELESTGKLCSLMVRSLDGRYSFDFARARDGVTVPAGSYALTAGLFGMGDNVARLRQGRMKPFSVPADEPRKVRWGGPLKAEFRYSRAADQLVIDPNDVTYFGAAGEEYKVWDPAGKSPEFYIRDLRTGAEIAKAMFPGSC